MWLGCIVTHRAVIAGFAAYASLAGPRLRASIPCPQIWGMVENAYGVWDRQVVWAERYAGMCSPLETAGVVQGLGFVMGNETTMGAGVSGERYGLVATDFLNGAPEEKAAALYLAFGPAFWVAILIHVVGTELWFRSKDGDKKALAGKDSLSSGKETAVTAVGEKGVKSL